MKNEKPRLLWSDEEGDLRKKKEQTVEAPVDEATIILNLRRLVAGKGRPVIEISNLPPNSKWCQDLAKEIKNKLACGGTYKNGIIEIHGEQLEKISLLLNKRMVRFKKIGG